ncbi:hypothetical protein ACLB2K_075028 [Fragaria x ananassa]
MRKSKIMFTNSLLVVLLIAAGLLAMTTVAQGPPHNYADALSKSILFFDGQRSGKLPSFRRMTWRKDSALHDGGDVQRDLMGGYYDGGDNVKFNFPMAFTTTMLSWSVLEFGNLMGPELQHALEALRWGTDYLLKSTNEPGSVVGVVGDPNADHACWERPEDMDTPRTSYVVTKEKPGSELSAEIAAALAASSIVFQQSDKAYSTLLLTRATQDELIWGASWLYKATKAAGYWKYVKDNIHYLESNTVWVMTDPAESNPFVPKADQLICSILPESPAPKSVTFSPGGLLFKAGYCNLQHTTSLSFLLLVYSQYLKGANRTIYCGDNVVLGPANLVDFTRKQYASGGVRKHGSIYTFTFPASEAEAKRRSVRKRLESWWKPPIISTALPASPPAPPTPPPSLNLSSEPVIPYTRRTRSDSTHSASAVAPPETATVPPSSVTTATIPSSATTTPPSASVIPNTDPFPPCAPGSASHTAVDFVPAPWGEVDKEMKVVVVVVVVVVAEILEKGAAEFGSGETEKGKEKRSVVMVVVVVVRPIDLAHAFLQSAKLMKRERVGANQSEVTSFGFHALLSLLYSCPSGAANRLPIFT